jgi:hypothetical protein
MLHFTPAAPYQLKQDGIVKFDHYAAHLVAQKVPYAQFMAFNNIDNLDGVWDCLRLPGFSREETNEFDKARELTAKTTIGLFVGK